MVGSLIFHYNTPCLVYICSRVRMIFNNIQFQACSGLVAFVIIYWQCLEPTEVTPQNEYVEQWQTQSIQIQMCMSRGREFGIS
jgi:hypothetical protein